MSTSNFYRARLIERQDFASDLGRFKFRPEGPFTFKSGQYATIAVEYDSKLIQRPYSVLSSPRENFLEFFIELVPQGELTPKLWDLKEGDDVWIRNRIVGAFTLDEKAGMNRHIMAATVTGIAPFLSMARTQKIDLESPGRDPQNNGGEKEPHRFLVIFGASRSWEFGPYHDELKELERLGWLTYVPTVSRPWEDPEWTGESGRVEDVVRQYASQVSFDYKNAVGYSCGHPQMIENVSKILQRARFQKAQIKEEKYFNL